MQKSIIILIFCLFFVCPPTIVRAVETFRSDNHPILSLVGETLLYDVSFLWFQHLAEGSLSLSEGEDPDTFLVVLEAKTLGVAAFFTRDRVEKYQTLMKIGPGGLLIPIWHSSHTIRGKGSSRREKVTRYDFDYASGQVLYQKIKDGRTYADQVYPLKQEIQLFDILSALYNLRLNFYPKLEMGAILIPTFHRKGPQDIVVTPLKEASHKDKKFFNADPLQYRILVDPEVFGTKGRDILASFDGQLRPSKGIIKNVIGLGDVHGTLRTP